ncbi:hypothetical protein ACYSNU_04870 [Enterococcus sp. LJL120]
MIMAIKKALSIQVLADRIKANTGEIPIYCHNYTKDYGGNQK